MPEMIKTNIPGKTSSAMAGTTRNKFFLQARLSINPSNDMYEQEADAVADKMMRMPDSNTGQNNFFKPAPQAVQLKCAHCEEEEKINRKEANAAEAAGSANMETYVGNLDNGGQPLSNEARNFYEPRLGYDFTNVKVHTDTIAAKSAQSINALAFTSGNHIVFNSGQYSPGTDSGKRLLGHELVHVIQQGKAASDGIQRKVIDDNAHVPCRSSRPTAFADLQAAEQKAIALSRGVAQTLKQFVPSHTGEKESAATHATREMLWRRLKLDYNRVGRCVLVPELISKYNTVADNIASVDYSYPCAAPGAEPPGACTNQPNVGYAWTAKGIPNTQICDAFWSVSSDWKARFIVHEFFHYSFGMGDCPTAAPDDNPSCYDLLAGEMGHITAAGETHGGCCPAPAEPLPEPDIASFDEGCPSGLTLHLPVASAGYSYGPGGHGMLETVGFDLGIPTSTLGNWEFTLGGRFTMLDSLAKDHKTSYLIGLRAGAQLRSRPWRDGFVFGGFLEGGGALNVPDKAGNLTSANYLEAGVKFEKAIKLPKDRALSLFTEFAGGQVVVNDNTLRFFTASAGISIDL